MGLTVGDHYFLAYLYPWRRLKLDQVNARRKGCCIHHHLLLACNNRALQHFVTKRIENRQRYVLPRGLRHVDDELMIGWVGIE